VRSEQEIIAALRALADTDGAVEGSPELEGRVTRAFRARQARRKWNRAAGWTLAAAAAVVIAIVVTRQPRPVAQQATYQSPRVVAAAESGTPVPVAPVRLHRTPRPRTREIVTEFFPLIDAPPPMGHGELFRVTVSAAAMRTVGLPVSEDRLADRVQADVLVSEDGFATAIRFVKNE
jgi:hypothetical protein